MCLLFPLLCACLIHYQPLLCTEGSTATEGTGSYGLTVVRDGTDGSWIIVSDTPPAVTPAISKRSLSCVRLCLALVLSVRRLSPLLIRCKPHLRVVRLA
jgi:hypothetical protein